jgi:hypothetical protein
MNSHLIPHINYEKFNEVIRSVELFVAIIFVTTAIAFVCVAIA